MTIREFLSKDKAAYLEMSNQFYHCGAAASPIPPENAERTFEQLIAKNPNLGGVILEENGVQAGYALYFTCWSCEFGGLVVFLDELYVSPDHRGKGFAGRLLRYLEDAFPDAAALRLEVCMTNRDAINLYERHGYTFLDYHQMRKVK